MYFFEEKENADAEKSASATHKSGSVLGSSKGKPPQGSTGLHPETHASSATKAEGVPSAVTSGSPTGTQAGVGDHRLSESLPVAQQAMSPVLPLVMIASTTFHAFL